MLSGGPSVTLKATSKKGKQMTLYESEVAFFDGLQDDLDEFKMASKNDDRFKEYLAEVGAEEALYLATTLHRQVADQVMAYNVPNAAVSEGTQRWLSGAVGLVSSVRKRRQQLRRVVIELYGQDAVNEVNNRVRNESEDSPAREY